MTAVKSWSTLAQPFTCETGIESFFFNIFSGKK